MSHHCSLSYFGLFVFVVIIISGLYFPCSCFLVWLLLFMTSFLFCCQRGNALKDLGHTSGGGSSHTSGITRSALSLHARRSDVLPNPRLEPPRCQSLIYSNSIELGMWTSGHQSGGTRGSLNPRLENPFRKGVSCGRTTSNTCRKRHVHV